MESLKNCQYIQTHVHVCLQRMINDTTIIAFVFGTNNLESLQKIGEILDMIDYRYTIDICHVIAKTKLATLNLFNSGYFRAIRIIL